MGVVVGGRASELSLCLSRADQVYAMVAHWHELMGFGIPDRHRDCGPLPNTI